MRINSPLLLAGIIYLLTPGFGQQAPPLSLLHTIALPNVRLLKWQFSRVAYRAAEDGYEVNGVVLLSASEARLIIDGTASLEEVVASRNCQ